MRKTKKKILLYDYMAARPEGLGMNDAVSMLFNVALQLRDMHNEGRPHLQVSPNSIYVCSDGARLEAPRAGEAGRYTSGYAAPEIYNEGAAGIHSDIYSFCALLSFVATGRHPENAAGMENRELSEEPARNTFEDVIRRGMAADISKRPGSMKEIMIALSVYNVRPFMDSELPDASKKNKEITHEKRGGLNTAIAVVAAAVVAVGAVGGYLVSYNMAKNAAQSGDLAKAERLLILPGITERHDSDLMDYIDAGRLLKSGDFEAAGKAYEKLSGYLDAAEKANKAMYSHGLKVAEEGDLLAAVNIMWELGDAGYKDAEKKGNEFFFQYGVEALEAGVFEEAYWAFNSLSTRGYAGAEEKLNETTYQWARYMMDEGYYFGAHGMLDGIRNYEGVSQLIRELEEEIYTQGVSLYWCGEYDSARENFEYLSTYKDSKKYLMLVNVLDENPWNVEESQIRSLMSDTMFYFENTADVLLRNQAFAEIFLKGTWKSGNYYFTMEENGSISYNLPWFEHGDYYRTEYGAILLYPEENEDDTKILFQITAKTPNCIEVLCYKDGKTYTLNRS